MLTVGAFASLAQLGSGLALALAIFVEPISVRENKRRKAIDNQIKLLPNLASETVEDKANSLYAELYELEESVKTARSKALAPMRLIKTGAFANFSILLLATVCPNAEVSFHWTWLLLVVSIVPVSIGAAWMEYIARSKIGSP